MPACLWIFIALSEAEIDNVDDMLIFTRPYQEVIWLYISVQKAVLMYELNSLQL
jgi:hypothetical protein